MQWFLFATILQGILILLLLYSNIALLVYHPPTSSRPFDTALIHAPLRFFLILPLFILFPLCLLCVIFLCIPFTIPLIRRCSVTLGLSFTPTVPGSPVDYSKWHAWTGFGVVLGTNLLGLIVVLLRRDVVCCVAATWVCVSIWSYRPKPSPVYVRFLYFLLRGTTDTEVIHVKITVIIFTALFPLALVTSFIHSRFYGQGRIILPPGDAHPGLYAHTNGADRSQGENGIDSDRVPREIEGDWS